MLENHVRIGMEVTYKNLKHKVNRKSNNGSYMLSIGDSYTYAFPNEFEPFPIPTTHQNRTEEVQEILKKEAEMVKKEIDKSNISQIKAPKHYDNTNGSLYLFCEQNGLNAWEFDCIKRIVRCRKKGEFISDIEKTIEVLKLYIQEYKK